MIAIIVAIVAVAVTAFIANYLVRGALIDAKLRKIPSPPGSIPILGHALQVVGGAPWDKFKSWCSGFGTICTFNIMGQRVVYTNDPKIIKRVLLTNQRNYNKDIGMSYRHFMCLLGKGLVTSEGEQWRKGRLLLSHALRIDILDDVPDIAVAAVGRLMAKMKNGTPVDLNEEYRHLTLQVIAQAAISFTPEEGDKVFGKLYLPIVHECNKRVWEPYREYMPWLSGFQERRRCLKELNAVLCDIIRGRWARRQEEAKQGIERKPDIMDRCMSQISDMPDSTVRQLRDDVKTMLLAGHETSAALLTWATYELMCNPDIRAEVVAEATAVFGPHIRNGTIPTMEDIKKLRWVPAVLKETMRHHPPLPLTMRLCMNDDTITAAESGLGYDVTLPRGCTVAVGIDGVHHREDIFPNANRFIPQRFLDEAANEVDPYAFIPFINGPRNCLGQHLALAETQIVLAYMMYHMELSLPTGGSLEKMGQPHEYIVPTVPKFGLVVVGAERATE